MDYNGQQIRQLLNANGPAGFDEKTSNDIASYQSRCRFRNLRGECANPNVIDEDGMMMSWDKYDAMKEKGVDPKTAFQASQQPQDPATQAIMRRYPPGTFLSGARRQ